MHTIMNIILKNRYTLLATVVAVYVLVLVVEGVVTGRDNRVIDFENPFFDLNVRNLEQFANDRRND